MLSICLSSPSVSSTAQIVRKDLSMIFICSYECTPIIHIIHKPNCEMMCEILSRPSSLSSSLVQLFSSLIVQNHSAIQYYLINLKPFRALHGSDWRFCKRVGPSGSSSCKRVFAFLFLSRIFLWPLLPDLIFLLMSSILLLSRELLLLSILSSNNARLALPKFCQQEGKSHPNISLKASLRISFTLPLATSYDFWQEMKMPAILNVCFQSFQGMEGLNEATCLVCGASTRTGLHYGTVTCYPCRAFFR